MCEGQYSEVAQHFTYCMNIANDDRVNVFGLQSGSCYGCFICNLLQICYTFLQELSTISSKWCSLGSYNENSCNGKCHKTSLSVNMFTILDTVLHVELFQTQQF